MKKSILLSLSLLACSTAFSAMANEIDLSQSFYHHGRYDMGWNTHVNVFQHKKSGNCYGIYGGFRGGMTDISCSDFNIATPESIQREIKRQEQIDKIIKAIDSGEYELKKVEE